MKRGLAILFFAGAAMFSTVHCAVQRESSEELVDPDLDDPSLDDPDFEEDTSIPKLKPEQIDKLFAMIDANKKGKVSVQDLLTFSLATRKSLAHKSSPQIAEAMDADKDGKLSLTEYLKDLNEMPQDDMVMQRKELETAMFKEADTNKDGVLNKDEFPAIFYTDINDAIVKIGTAHAMKEKDTDGDGKLTVVEFWQGGEASDGAPTDIEENEFQMVDKDQDGFVDLQEMTMWESGLIHIESAMKDLISVADADNDTLVSREELTKAHDAVRQTDGFYHFADWVKHHEL